MPERILIIDDDLDTLRLVGLMLQKQGYQILAANSGSQGLQQASEQLPDLILLDVMMPGMDGYEVARRLRTNPSTAGIPILMFTAKSQLDDKVEGFEAGADDYLTKPTHPTELQAHVKALLTRAKARGMNPPTAPPTEEPGKIVGVISARGGLGVTTIALNLSSALRQKTKSDVVFIELRPGQGTAAFDLGLDEPHGRGLNMLLTTVTGDIHRDRIRESLYMHESGIKLLAASHTPKDSALAATGIDQVEAIATRMPFIARYTIFDLGPGLPIVSQKMIRHCHQLVLVLEPTEGSVQHTRALISDLIGAGVDKRRILTVLNFRMRSDLYLSMNQVTEKLAHPVSVTVTAMPELLMQAGRKKTTAFFAQPEGLTAQQFIQLTNQLIERMPR